MAKGREKSRPFFIEGLLTMKIKLRRSFALGNRGDIVDVHKVDGAHYIGLKVADEVDAKGNARPAPGSADPSKALPNGGPDGSASASALSPAAQVQEGSTGSGAPRRRGTAAPGS